MEKVILLLALVPLAFLVFALIDLVGNALADLRWYWNAPQRRRNETIQAQEACERVMAVRPAGQRVCGR